MIINLQIISENFKLVITLHNILTKSLEKAIK